MKTKKFIGMTANERKEWMEHFSSGDRLPVSKAYKRELAKTAQDAMALPAFAEQPRRIRRMIAADARKMRGAGK